MAFVIILGGGYDSVEDKFEGISTCALSNLLIRQLTVMSYTNQNNCFCLDLVDGGVSISNVFLVDQWPAIRIDWGGREHTVCLG